jgi:hypothetical protein
MLVRFCHTFVLTSFILSATISSSFAAKVYHWVDDKGQPHYSENPPRKIKSDTLNIKATGAGSASNAQTSKFETEPATKKKEAPKSLTAEHSQEDKAKYCQQSRDLMQNMNGNSQRRFAQPDGSYKKLTPAEIADYRSQAQAGIEAYCQ